MLCYGKSNECLLIGYRVLRKEKKRIVQFNFICVLTIIEIYTVFMRYSKDHK